MTSADTLRERSQTDSSPAARSKVDERRATAWIGQGVVVEGRITSSQDLTIDGRVEGSVEVGDHVLIVGARAAVKANLVAKSIVIGGRVIGNITATDRLDLQRGVRRRRYQFTSTGDGRGRGRQRQGRCERQSHQEDSGRLSANLHQKLSKRGSLRARGSAECRLSSALAVFVPHSRSVRMSVARPVTVGPRHPKSSPPRYDTSTLAWKWVNFPVPPENVHN